MVIMVFVFTTNNDYDQLLVNTTNQQQTTNKPTNTNKPPTNKPTNHQQTNKGGTVSCCSHPVLWSLLLGLCAYDNGWS